MYYPNYFAVKLTDLGEVSWARYYMKSNASTFDKSETSTIATVPTGGYITLLSRSNGLERGPFG
ncbi:MAG: hypothetical protein IPO12_09220 [Flavobacteriales bacterium]|nr:hypothetical protein [Flavobacteriales bacterium]